MNNLWLYIAKSLRVWLSVFVVAKFYFLVINTQNFGRDIIYFPEMWWHGLRLDLSVIGYILIIPTLLFLSEKLIRFSLDRWLKVYYWIVFVFVCVVLAADPYFFLYWGQKANTSFTQFIGKENAGLASIEISHYLIAFTFIVLLSSRFAAGWIRLVTRPPKTTYFSILVLALLVAGMIRSSIGKVPINISSAFYSDNNLYNNTAINAIWSAASAEVEKKVNKSMHFFEDSLAQRLYNEMYDETKSIELENLIQFNKSTNVVLIVLESFSAKAIGFLYGNEFASTPNLDKYMHQGIAFTQAYASSFRSDKGLLALTYGIPATAYQTLTNFPEYLATKTSTFSLFPSNYQTSFYYGGDIEFANIKVLFKDADKQFVQQDFASQRANAWGVHDEVVFSRAAQDFLKEQAPQFKMIFSLSSHEPFDVPNFKVKEDRYLNSISYTDSCLGVLVEKIRKSPKWKNTLIIITADHGTVRPNNAPVFDTTNFRIPLVFLGGIVQKDTVINEIVSQTNVPATFAALLRRKNPYPQPSVFSPANKAFYSYADGLVMVAPNCVQRYDFAFKNYVSDACLPSYERAYYQVSNKLFFTN